MHKNKQAGPLQPIREDTPGVQIYFRHHYTDDQISASVTDDWFLFIYLIKEKNPHKHYTQLEKTNAWICEYRCNVKFIHAFYLNILNGMDKLVTLSVERRKSIP